MTNLKRIEAMALKRLEASNKYFIPKNSNAFTNFFFGDYRNDLMGAIDNHIKKERPFSLRFTKCSLEDMTYPYNKKKGEWYVYFKCGIRGPKWSDDWEVDYLYVNAKMMLNLDTRRIELSNILTQLFRNDEEIKKGEMKNFDLEMKSHHNFNDFI